ncbi:MAG TPA: dTMP kinase, partial [Urbifossiella sp.]
MPRPAFISLDGLDGTGKSTQCRLLAEWLAEQKIPAITCTDPGGTPLGQELRKILLFGREHAIATATEAMLFMASRAQLVADVIRPALDRGECVVSDRFTLANVVYQGHAGGMRPDDLWKVGAVAAGG